MQPVELRSNGYITYLGSGTEPHGGGLEDTTDPVPSPRSTLGAPTPVRVAQGRDAGVGRFAYGVAMGTEGVGMTDREKEILEGASVPSDRTTGGAMRKSLACMAAVAVLTILVGASPASADQLYHSGHIAFAAMGGAPLRSGFVENIHPNGPNVFAHEQYVVNGAEPNTTYQVWLTVYDPTCSASLFAMQTATITTNEAGNGTAFHVFTPADATGLHGLTIGGIWTLTTGGAPEYATGCSIVHLD